MTPTVRNLRFKIDGTLPKHWHGGRRSVTIFLDNLSVFFPAGERFFAKAVRAHQSFMKDEQLMKEVRAFCGQEGVHGREHERMNEMVRRQGYPIEAMEKRVEAILDRVSKRSPELAQLGVTCALEHFTALMGEMLLGSAGLLEGAHPAMVALWRWHAAEENEVRRHPPLRARVVRAREVPLHRAGRDVTALPALPRIFSPELPPVGHHCAALLESWRREFDEAPVYVRSAAAARTAPRELAVAS